GASVAATDGAEQVARSSPLLVQADASAALHGDTSGGRTAVARRVSPAKVQVRAQAKNRRTGQPGASAHSGNHVALFRANRARSEGDSPFGMGLGEGCVRHRDLWTEAGLERGAGTRSVYPFSRSLAGATAGAGLFADRAGCPAARARRSA